MAAAAVIGYTVLLHTQLFNVFPALAFLPLFCIIVIAYFVAKSSRGRAISKVQAVRTLSSSIKDVKRGDHQEVYKGSSKSSISNAAISDEYLPSPSESEENASCINLSFGTPSGDGEDSEIDYDIDFSDVDE